MPADERRLLTEGVFIMLALLLKILSISGMILLILLAVLFFFLFLVLFFPITYRIFGKKKEEETMACIRARWLFGVLRLNYAYPEPGNLQIKLLWMTLFDSHKLSSSGKKQKNAKSGTADKEQPDQNEVSKDNAAVTEKETADRLAEETVEVQAGGEQPDTDAGADSEKSFLLRKYEKIVYTFHNIYDKIRHIWENISCYKALLEEEETLLLFAHAKKRAGKIWRSIRPRKLRADLVFGTGSPDTTGYAYGIYGMLSPQLGHAVIVTPDFTQAIFQGELAASGRITLFCLLWHGGRLAFDKKLHLFISRLKAIKQNGGKNGR